MVFLFSTAYYSRSFDTYFCADRYITLVISSYSVFLFYRDERPLQSLELSPRGYFRVRMRIPRLAFISRTPIQLVVVRRNFRCVLLKNQAELKHAKLTGVCGFAHRLWKYNTKRRTSIFDAGDLFYNIIYFLRKIHSSTALTLQNFFYPENVGNFWKKNFIIFSLRICKKQWEFGQNLSLQSYFLRKIK